MNTRMKPRTSVAYTVIVSLAAVSLVAGCKAPETTANTPAPVKVALKSPEVKTGDKSTRRNVKTSIDPDAAKIDLSAKDTTVEDIVAQKAPGGDLKGRVAPFETSTWRVHATLASVKLMKDGDYYLVLKGSKGGETVVEVPDPKDCKGSPLLPQITAARTELENRYHPSTQVKELHDQATVTGVGFLGFNNNKKPGKGKSGSRLMPGIGFDFSETK